LPKLVDTKIKRIETQIDDDVDRYSALTKPAIAVDSCQRQTHGRSGCWLKSKIQWLKVGSTSGWDLHAVTLWRGTERCWHSPWPHYQVIRISEW